MYRPSSLPQPCDAAAWTLPPPPSTTLLPACNRRRSTAELPATAALRHTTFWQGAQGGSSPWGSSQQTYRRRAWSQAGQPAVQCIAMQGVGEWVGGRMRRGGVGQEATPSSGINWMGSRPRRTNCCRLAGWLAGCV